MFRCYSYAVVREHINVLPDNGVTVTPKHVGAILM